MQLRFVSEAVSGGRGARHVAEVMGDAEEVPHHRGPQFRLRVHLCLHAGSGPAVKEIQKHGPSSNSFLTQNESVFLKSYMAKLEETLSLEIVSYYTKFCIWLSRMESVATSNSSLRGIQNRDKDMMIVQERLSNRVILLVEGFNLILKLNKLLYLCMVLHTMETRPIKN